MSELIWADPPPDRRLVFSDETIAALRAHPGRWAVIRRYPNRTAIKGRDVIKHPVDIEVRGVAEAAGSVLYARAQPRPGAGGGR